MRCINCIVHCGECNLLWPCGAVVNILLRTTSQAATAEALQHCTRVGRRRIPDSTSIAEERERGSWQTCGWRKGQDQHGTVMRVQGYALEQCRALILGCVFLRRLAVQIFLDTHGEFFIYVREYTSLIMYSVKSSRRKLGGAAQNELRKMNQPPEQLQPILTQEMCDVVAGTKLDRGWDEVRYERRTGWREAVWTGTAREPNRVGLTKSMDVITNKEKTKGEIADLYWSMNHRCKAVRGVYIYTTYSLEGNSSPLLAPTEQVDYQVHGECPLFPFERGRVSGVPWSQVPTITTACASCCSVFSLGSAEAWTYYVIFLFV